MSRRGSVAQWRTMIYKTHRITPTVRVLMLWFSDNMSAQRVVSVPRYKIAAALGVHERRIDEQIKAAREAGVLDVVSRGYRGRTAVYMGMFPSSESTTKTSVQSLPKTRALSPDHSRSDHAESTTDLQRTNVRADLSVTTHHRNVSSYEKPSGPHSPCPTCADDGCSECVA